jgi:hypothetical protein
MNKKMTDLALAPVRLLAAGGFEDFGFVAA